MKVQKYVLPASNGRNSTLHGGEFSVETRLYFPNQALIAYTEDGLLFLTTDPSSFRDAENNIEQIKTGTYRRWAEYRGEVEVPDELVERIIAAERSFREAKSFFQRLAGELTGHLH